MRTPLRRSIAQVLKIARAGGRSLRQRIWSDASHRPISPNSGAIGLPCLAIGPPTRTAVPECLNRSRPGVRGAGNRGAARAFKMVPVAAGSVWRVTTESSQDEQEC